MAIRRGFATGRIGPSLKGRLYSYTSNAGEIVASWPKPQIAPRSEDQEINMRLFKEACRIMKTMAPEFIAYAAKNSKGKPMLPRDALMAALYGRGPVLHYPSGEVLRPMAVRVDMSTLMDNIAWRPNSILVRYEDTWEGLDPPDELKFLGFTPDNGIDWIDAPGGDASWQWMQPTEANADTLSFNCKGHYVLPTRDIEIDTLTFRTALATGIVSRVTIYEVNTSLVVQSILTDEATGIIGNGTQRFDTLVLPASVILLAGHKYVIALRCPLQATNYGTPLYGFTPAWVPFATEPFISAVRVANAAPGIGTTFASQTAGGMRCIGMRFR